MLITEMWELKNQNQKKKKLLVSIYIDIYCCAASELQEFAITQQQMESKS